jgi:hypothetical protein
MMACIAVLSCSTVEDMFERTQVVLAASARVCASLSFGIFGIDWMARSTTWMELDASGLSRTSSVLNLEIKESSSEDGNSNVLVGLMAFNLSWVEYLSSASFALSLSSSCSVDDESSSLAMSDMSTTQVGSAGLGRKRSIEAM